MQFPPRRTNGSGGLAFKFLTVQREQVSETLGKDRIYRESRRRECTNIILLWEADVLPLHHSRGKQKSQANSSLFGCFQHCN